MTVQGEQSSSKANAPLKPDDTSPDIVLETALEMFATLGFSDAKLDEVARRAGMSKRMIHYYFGDKKGLYRLCLETAVQRLRPSQEAMTLETNVPVEGVRKLVEAVYQTYVDNPFAVRILAMENLHHYAQVESSAPLSDQSEISLQLDRLLMLGQDAGAFRPGIAAQDVFTLIASLATFRIESAATTLNLYGIDLLDEENTAGMGRLAVDAVLAFLTSNIKSDSSMSYLSGVQGVSMDSDVEDFTYEIDTDPFE